MEIAIIAGAGLIVLIVLGVGIYSIRRQREAIIDERLDKYTSDYGSSLSELLQIETDSNLKGAGAQVALQEAVDSRIKDRDFAKKWREQLAKADLKITPAEFLGIHVISVLIFFFVGGFILFGNPIVGVICGVAGFFAPRIYVARKTGKRLHLFEDQLADDLQMLVNGLRSGYSVMQAVEAVAREAPEPTSTEFRRVVQETQLGIPLDDALNHMLQRLPSEDFDLVVTAINIQREVGGNLAEILEIISHTIRERIKLKGEIRVMTAQGRVTGYIISGLPVFLLAFLMMVNREYVGRFFTNRLCGWPMLGCGAGMIALGAASIQKIVDIEI
jgi:tight adherence protein B